MREDEVGRWLAWRHEDIELEVNELPYFGALVDTTFYHGGSSSYMPFPRDAVVLRDFGYMTLDDAIDMDIDSAFWSCFPPTHGTLDELLELGSGWVAPQGTVYPCVYGSHRLVAKRLIHAGTAPGILDSFEGALLWSRHEDWLLHCRWVRLSPYLVMWDDQNTRLTRAQMQVLVDITGKPSSNRLGKRLVSECKRAVRTSALTASQ